LREQFHSESQSKSPNTIHSSSYDATRQLLHSGAQAAAELVELSAAGQEQAISLSRELAAQWLLYKSGAPMSEFPSSGNRAQPLPANWQILYQWLLRQRANGEAASASSPFTHPKA
jgi:hypothetical protein